MLPGGSFSERYEQDLAIVRTRLQWGLLVVFLLLLLVLPLFAGRHWLTVVNLAAITVISVLGLNILTGYCGQISLGQAAFMAVGAYSTGIFATRFGLPFWICIPCSGLVTALIGMVFGLPSLRVKGFYLALATLAAQIIITYSLVHMVDLTGGVFGLTMPVPQLGGFAFNTDVSMYFLIIVIAFIMGLIAKNLVRTRAGRAFVAIRDNDIAAEVLGINVFYYKLLAFGICSFYAGVAGSLFAYYICHIVPEHFTLIHSILQLAMIVIGGLGSTLGAIIGVVFLKGLEELTMFLAPFLTALFPAITATYFASSVLILYGFIIALFLIFEPRGLAHRWEVFKASYRIWPYSY